VSRIEQAWQTRGLLAILLWPVSLLYQLITATRRIAYTRGWKVTHPPSLPVVVVGNISVGGTGKSPLCAHLVGVFQKAGWKPGIVSRGYGGQRRELPHLISAEDTPATVGDEPLMLFEQTAVPVCVCVKRALAVDHLAEHTDVNIVFADDGLQHLAMSRAAEIVVIDGRRGLGNGWLLPAGPLRESAKRLDTVDLIAVQAADAIDASLLDKVPASCRQALESHHFQLTLTELVSLHDGRRVALREFSGCQVIAMAGIGHPERFFDALRESGMQVTTGTALPDHHAYSLDDFAANDALPVLVTSKDAVKLRALGPLPVEVFEVVASVSVTDALQQRIAQLENRLRECH